jgi:hypothetical protein
MLFHHKKSLDILWATSTSILSPLKDPISMLLLQYYSPIFTLDFQVVLCVQICKLQCPTWLQIGVESKLSFLIFLICVLQEMPHNYTLFMKQLLLEPYYLHVLKSGSLSLLEPPWPVLGFLVVIWTLLQLVHIRSMACQWHGPENLGLIFELFWLIAIGFETSWSRCT